MTQTPTVVVIGNFDGLHRGHASLFARARALADARGGRVVAMPFTRHPRRALRPEKAPPTVLHQDQRAARLADLGAEIDWLDPERSLLEQTAEQFISSIVERFQPIAVVEGANFRFGRNRIGDIQALERMGSEHGFEAVVEPLVVVRLRDKTLATVSTSLVRWLLLHGRVADATLCLGRPWQMQGRVVEGDRRGTLIGVPTANLDTAPQMLPADGVYAGFADVDGRAYPAALSVGRKPTFGGAQRLAEAHLLGYDGDLYGRTLRIDVLRYRRDQWRMPDVDALRRQLADDMAFIRAAADGDLLDPAAMAVSPEA